MDNKELTNKRLDPVCYRINPFLGVPCFKRQGKQKITMQFKSVYTNIGKKYSLTSLADLLTLNGHHFRRSDFFRRNLLHVTQRRKNFKVRLVSLFNGLSVRYFYSPARHFQGSFPDVEKMLLQHHNMRRNAV